MHAPPERSRLLAPPTATDGRSHWRWARNLPDALQTLGRDRIGWQAIAVTTFIVQEAISALAITLRSEADSRVRGTNRRSGGRR